MICERCKSEAVSLKMSFFNNDMCCHECLKKEQSHPKYNEAKEKEIEECKKGNYNFEGVGLPSDFSRFLENRSNSYPEIDIDFGFERKESLKRIKELQERKR